MRMLTSCCVAAMILVHASGVLAVDEAHLRKARTMIGSSMSWLRTQQDTKTGGWSVNPDPKSPQFPAITGLVLNGMLMDKRLGTTDPVVQRGVKFMLSYQQPDGGIYDRALPAYNTAICVSALSKLHTPEAAAAMQKAAEFLRGLQWGEQSIDDKAKDTGKVDAKHPFYGGLGYGKTGRPDLSNLSFFLQAMHDAGVASDDPCYQRAVVFLTRTQMLGDVNDMEFAKGSKQGGFIYSTTPDNKPENLGKGESKAGTIEETLDDGTRTSRLRCYGSMTYAGFKGYIYANLSRDDPRVKAAYDWVRGNYTLAENPGIGANGVYYYYVTFSRSLKAWGLPTIQTMKHDGTPGETKDWANDLIDRLSELQNADGSFKQVDERWMENNPVLITAYGLLALQEAVD